MLVDLAAPFSTAETDGGRATIKLNAGAASKVELYYLAQPHGGVATLTADGAALATVELADDVAGYHAQALPLRLSAPASMAVIAVVTAAVIATKNFDQWRENSGAATSLAMAPHDHAALRIDGSGGADEYCFCFISRP